jgi:Mg-chelatase subunit ChlD
MTALRFLATVGLLLVAPASLLAAEQERFRIRSMFVDQASEVSAIVELPGEPMPQSSDFRLLIDDKLAASARETSSLDLNILFLVDVSGSMRGTRNDSPLNDAKKSLSSFLDKTREQDRFALISFADTDKFRSSFNDPRDRVKQSVEKLQTEGTKTLLYQALDNALKNSPKDDPRTRRIFIVISDGKDEGSEVQREQVMKDSNASLVPIYTIFRGKTEPPFADILRELAKSGGGTFYSARNEPELTSALQEIYQLEKNSLLVRFSYQRDAAGAATENAAIELRRPDGTALRAKLPEKIPALLIVVPPPPPIALWQIGLLLAALLGGLAFWLWRRSQKPAPVYTIPSTVEIESEPAAAVEPPVEPRHRTTVIGQYFPVPGSGQPAVILRGVAGPVDGRQHAVEKEIFSIGANAENDLPIAEDEYVSGEHAYLRYEKGSLFIFDKASRNGTFVNDAKVPESGFVLRSGDRIKLGDSTFEVVMPSG